MLAGERLLLVDRITADAHALCTDRGALRGEVAEVAASFVQPAVIAAGVEEEHDRPVVEEVAQPPRRTGLVRELKVVDEVTTVHVAR